MTLQCREWWRLGQGGEVGGLGMFWRWSGRCSLLQRDEVQSHAEYQVQWQSDSLSSLLCVGTGEAGWHGPLISHLTDGLKAP